MKNPSVTKKVHPIAVLVTYTHLSYIGHTRFLPIVVIAESFRKKCYDQQRPYRHLNKRHGRNDVLIINRRRLDDLYHNQSPVPFAPLQRANCCSNDNNGNADANNNDDNNNKATTAPQAGADDDSDDINMTDRLH